MNSRDRKYTGTFRNDRHDMGIMFVCRSTIWLFSSNSGLDCPFATQDSPIVGWTMGQFQKICDRLIAYRQVITLLVTDLFGRYQSTWDAPEDVTQVSNEV